MCVCVCVCAHARVLVCVWVRGVCACENSNDANFMLVKQVARTRAPQRYTLVQLVQNLKQQRARVLPSMLLYGPLRKSPGDDIVW